MAQTMRQSSLEGQLETDVEIKSSAKKFYNMIIEKPQDVPKATPDNIQGCDLIHLDEGKFVKVGSILSWNYVLDGQQKVMKERIDALEPERNWISSSVVGGDLLKEFKSLLFTMQIIPKQSGPGSVVKCTAKYERTDENVAPPEKLLSMFVKVFKDMDEMLLSQV